MPKPSAERLDADVQHYRTIGINVIVSLLAKTEATELGLQAEAITCANHHLQFLQLGIPDFGLPALAPFTTLVRQIATKLTNGESVAVHCRAGIGRSGMLACCTLIELGLSPADAIEQVTTSRGQEVPDNDQQTDFIYRFSKAAASSST